MRQGTRRHLLGHVLAGLAGLATVALVPGAPRALAAASSDGSAETFVGGFAQAILATLRDTSLSPAQRARQIDEQVSRNFALERIARIALGRYWKTASEAERAEFSALFKRSVLATYSRRFDEYADRRLRVVGAVPSGDQVMVETYLEGAATPARLDWRVASIDGRWRILDVMVEGVSLVVTYRNEFATVIEQGGGQVSALIGELRTRAGASAT